MTKKRGYIQLSYPCSTQSTAYGMPEVVDAKPLEAFRRPIDLQHLLICAIELPHPAVQFRQHIDWKLSTVPGDAQRGLTTKLGRFVVVAQTDCEQGHPSPFQSLNL